VFKKWLTAIIPKDPRLPRKMFCVETIVYVNLVRPLPNMEC